MSPKESKISDFLIIKLTLENTTVYATMDFLKLNPRTRQIYLLKSFRSILSVMKEIGSYGSRKGKITSLTLAL